MSQGDKEARVFSADQKYKIVKEGLTTDLGISGVCRKYGISSGLYYKWQEKFLDGAKQGLERKSVSTGSTEQRKIETQAKELDRMKSVIAEITAENIDFKKKLGE